MKRSLSSFNPLIRTGILSLLLLSGPLCFAQAPISLSGNSVVSCVSTGIYPFSPKGYFLFVPADSGETYKLFGIKGVVDSEGPYTYQVNSQNEALLTLKDTAVGSILDLSTYDTPTSGRYRSTSTAVADVYQEGTFQVFQGDAPASAAGLSFVAMGEDGAYPFGRGGVFSFSASPAGDTYVIAGSGLNGWYNTGSTGTVQCAKLNRSTASFRLQDSVSGDAAMYLAFTNTLGGWYGVKSSQGFQVGRFYALGFLGQPGDRIVEIGGQATFSVRAGGAGPLSYQWCLNGSPIPGATQPTYSADNVQTVDSGKQFTCVVSNASASSVSRTAKLIVTTNRVITLLASNLWADTGVLVSTGQTVRIRAAGSWIWSGAAVAEFGPEGDVLDLANADDLFSSTAVHGALIAYVGADPYQGHWGDKTFFPRASGYWSIGASNEFASPVSGRLWVGFNDDATTRGIEDNEGLLTVELIGVAPVATMRAKILSLTRDTVEISIHSGLPTGTVRVLSSLELAAPLSAWTEEHTLTLDTSGSATFTLPRRGAARMFYTLSLR